MSTRTEAFQQELRELGYAEGKNIVIEYRYAEGRRDRLPALAAELVRLNVDIIVSAGGYGTVSPAKQATNTIPIVMTNVTDPVGTGFIATLARPGGNITGLAALTDDLAGKRVELIKETFSKISRMAVLLDPEDASKIVELKSIQALVKGLGLNLQAIEVRSGDFESAFNTATRERAGALLVLQNAVTNTGRKPIADLATKHRLPTMWAESGLMDAGGLMSYGPSHADMFRRSATYVDKILKGAKPGDLPVEQPTKFELVINLKTANQIGLTIPPNVLARADRVIK
jgi:putative ABC transport system substrate-binding protein